MLQLYVVITVLMNSSWYIISLITTAYGVYEMYGNQLYYVESNNDDAVTIVLPSWYCQQ